MKNDLISRNAFIRFIDVGHFRHPAELCYSELDVANLIKNFPAVDAVEVVRCKDCKWYKEGELLAPNKFCFRLMHPTDNRHIGYNFSGDDFCSYGERKDND